MAIDTKIVNRSTSWTTDEKKRINAFFALAESAATGSDSTIISDDAIHYVLANKLNANAAYSLRAIANNLRAGIDAQDDAWDLEDSISISSFISDERRILRRMFNDVVAQIV